MNPGSNMPGDRPGMKRPGGTMKAGSTGAPSRSQLIPGLTNWRDLPSKPYFLPGMAAAIVTVMLWVFLDSDPVMAYTVWLYGQLPVRVPLYTITIALLMSCGMAYAVYRMVGKNVQWWLMPAVAAFAGFLVESPALDLCHKFLSFGVEDLAPPTASILTAFVKAIFAAGLPEEALKSIPVFIGALLIARLKPKGALASFSVTEPLDGILIGVAAGIGFAFVETVGQYVPNDMVGGDGRVAQLLSAYKALQQQFGTAVAIAQVQLGMQGTDGGLQLLIPRLLGDVSQHPAWAGIFGYYIGLSAMKPEARWKILGTGLAFAVCLHALWDATQSDLIHGILSVASFGILGTVVMKARELSPERSRLMNSQLFDRFSRVVAPTRSSTVDSAEHRPAARPATAAGATSMTWDDGDRSLILEIGNTRMPISVGARLLERQAPGTSASRGDGVVGEISANPRDPSQLGVRNHSNQIWKVTTPSGECRELTPGRSVQLLRGAQIQLGDLVATIK